MLPGDPSQRSFSASRRPVHRAESRHLPPGARSSNASAGTCDVMWVFSHSGNCWVEGDLTDVIDDTYVRVEYTLGEQLCGKTLPRHSEDLFIHAGATVLEEADPQGFIAVTGGSRSRSRSTRAEYGVLPGDLIIFDGLLHRQDLNGHHGVVLKTSPEQESYRRLLVMILTTQGTAAPIVAKPENLKQAKRATDMKTFFSRDYLFGLDLVQSDEYRDPGWDTKCYQHCRTGIHVWKHALDLRSSDDGNFTVVFHYTNVFAACNITDRNKPNAEIWASLRDRDKADKDQQDTGFGEGVYVSKFGPEDWKSKEQILVNNFCNVVKFEGKADFCIPLLVPTSVLEACHYMKFGTHKGWHIQEHFYTHMFTDKVCSTCQTRRDDVMRQTLQRHNIDKFQRDVWIVKVVDEAAVQNAITPLINLFKNRLEVRKEVFGEKHPTTLDSYVDFGWCLNSQGKLLEAELVWRKAVEGLEEAMGKKHPMTLASYSDFGWCLNSQGKFQEAELVLRKGMEGLEEVMGKKNPRTLDSYVDFGTCLNSQGKLQEAELVLRKAVEGLEDAMGKKSPTTLDSYVALGRCLKTQGKFQEAEPVLRKGMEGLEEAMGKKNPRTLYSYVDFGWCLNSQGKLLEAEPVLRKAMEGLEEVMGKKNPRTLYSYVALGRCLNSQGKLQEAEPVLRKGMEGLEEAMGKKHPMTLHSYVALGRCLNSQGKFQEAEPVLRKGMEGLEGAMGKKNPRTLDSYVDFGWCLNSQGKFQEAEPVLRKGMEGLEEVMGKKNPTTLHSYVDFATCLNSQGKLQEAELVLRKAVQGLEEAMGKKSPTTLDSYVALGRCLNSQGKFQEAELVLRKAVEGFEEVMGKKHPKTLALYADLGRCLARKADHRKQSLLCARPSSGFHQVSARKSNNS